LTTIPGETVYYLYLEANIKLKCISTY